jgi:hypothetical protein
MTDLSAAQTDDKDENDDKDVDDDDYQNTDDTAMTFTQVIKHHHGIQCHAQQRNNVS